MAARGHEGLGRAAVSRRHPHWVEALETRRLLSSAVGPLAIEMIDQWADAADAVAIDGEIAYVGRGAELTVLDLSSTEPSVWATLPLAGTIRDIALDGDFAYIAAGDAGLLLVDVSYVGSPSWLATYVTPGHASGVSIADGLIYLADADEGIMVLRLVDNRIEPPAFNDHFADRTPITGASAFVTGSNASATAEPGEPSHADEPGGKSVWWTWTAPASGIVTLTTVGSSFDTLLAVYTGDSVDALMPIAANDDERAGVWTSRVSFAAGAGVAYQIAVDGYGGDSGMIALQLDLAVPEASGPPNDNFANRAAITGTSATIIGSNVGASYETGEPAHAGSWGFVSVWWTWTAPASGPVTVSTAGSNFDTILAVYTGEVLNALTVVAGNDDERQGVWTSRVTFTAEAGTTYQIAVDGFDGDMGMISLSLEQDGEVSPVWFDLLDEWDIPAGIVAAWGGRLSVASGSTLTVYDVATGAPVPMGTLGLSAAIADIRMAGSLAFISAAGGLRVVDLADPAQPVLHATQALPGRGGVDVVGNQVYVATGDAGVVVLGIDPAAALIANRAIDLALDASQQLVALMIADAGWISVAPGATRLIDTAGLWIGDAGALDLADNALVLRATPQTRQAAFARVTAWLREGVIVSSAADGLTTLVAILNDRGDGVPIRTTFGGAAVGVNDILVMHTWQGDLNLDGRVDADDYLQIDRGFLRQTASPRLQDGDLDQNGLIDGDDYFLLDSAFLGQTERLGTALQPAGAAVPAAQPFTAPTPFAAAPITPSAAASAPAAPHASIGELIARMADDLAVWA